MCNIEIDMFPALAGDSFLVTVNSKHRTNILIDCGYPETYRNFLKKEFKRITDNKEAIDLMVISHIDADHISGALDFLNENNSLVGKKEFININEIWHNSLRHVYSKERKEGIIEACDKEILENIKMKGIPIPSDSSERIGRKISAVQGSTLSGLIVKGGYSWNSKANGEAISIENINDACYINETRIVVLSPNNSRLLNLELGWKKDLNRSKKFKGEVTKDEIFDDVFEILLGQSFDERIRKKYSLISGGEDLKSYICEQEELDETPINCSSISFILEYNKKKVLFLGDSNPNDICEKIKELYKWDGRDRIFFDAIKISHHGSSCNTSKKLLEVIDSDKFIISTNGNRKYNHPDMDTIAKIVCRDTENIRELIFNYRNSFEKFNNKKWMSTYKYKIRNVKDNEVQQIYI